MLHAVYVLLFFLFYRVLCQFLNSLCFSIHHARYKVTEQAKRWHLWKLYWIFYFTIITGPFCKHRHRRRVFCPNYLAGFCPEGKECKYAHPSFNSPPIDATQLLRAKGVFNIGIVCHNCHERGHKVSNSVNFACVHWTFFYELGNVKAFNSCWKAVWNMTKWSKSTILSKAAAPNKRRQTQSVSVLMQRKLWGWWSFLAERLNSLNFACIFEKHSKPSFTKLLMFLNI